MGVRPSESGMRPSRLERQQRSRRRSPVEQAFDFSSAQAFDAGEARVKTHLLNGGKIAIQGTEGGPVADLTEPFGLASLPAFIRRELTTDAAQDSIAQVVARMARQYAVEERCQTLLL